MLITPARTLVAALLTSTLVLGVAGAANAVEDSTPDEGGLLTPVAAVAPNFTITNANGTTTTTPIPATVDLTRYAVPVGDQGSLDSCASWATGYSMVGWYANKLGYAASSFAPMYLYSQTHLNYSSGGGGSYATSNYNVLETQGIALQSDYPQGNYNFTDAPSSSQQDAAATFKASTYHTLFASTNPEGYVGNDAQIVIQKALAAGHPVGIAIPMYDAFYGLNSSDYTLNLSDPGAESNYSGGHYILALGYDAQGLTVQNQWGTNWGKSGYAKLGWDFVNRHAIEAEYIEGIFKDIPASKYKAPANDMLLENTMASPSSLKLHWYAPSNTGTTKLSRYTLHIVGNDYDSTRNYGTGASGYSVTANGLNPDSDYAYTMTATNTLGLSASASATFHTTASGTVTSAASPRAAAYDTGLEPDESAAPAPSVTPTAEPSAEPTPSITPEPVVEPTPSITPSAEPTVEPSPSVTPEPTVEPTPVITPTVEPTPSITPSAEPTSVPTVLPEVPVIVPSAEPSIPATVPTVEPTLPIVQPTVPANVPSVPARPSDPAVVNMPKPVQSAAPVTAEAPRPQPVTELPPAAEQPVQTIVPDPTPKTRAAAPKWSSQPSAKASAKSATISWKALPKSGSIVKYSLTVKQGKKKVQALNYSPKTTKVTLKKLRPHTKYTLVLSVRNSFGLSVSKTFTFKTR